MNINPYGKTMPHYDSYDDFYKYFEVSPQQTEEGSSPFLTSIKKGSNFFHAPQHEYLLDGCFDSFSG